jgi:hypothetical protein
MSETEKGIAIGSSTVLVDVGGGIPLVLVGVIQKLVSLKIGPRNGPAFIFPGKQKKEDIEVEVEGEVTELEQFLIIDATTATLPPGFPLTIAQLTATDVAVNLDYVILILPVEA